MVYASQLSGGVTAGEASCSPADAEAARFAMAEGLCLFVSIPSVRLHAQAIATICNVQNDPERCIIERRSLHTHTHSKPALMHWVDMPSRLYRTLTRTETSRLSDGEYGEAQLQGPHLRPPCRGHPGMRYHARG
jgi:hypothetical protein